MSLAVKSKLSTTPFFIKDILELEESISQKNLDHPLPKNTEPNHEDPPKTKQDQQGGEDKVEGYLEVEPSTAAEAKYSAGGVSIGPVKCATSTRPHPYYRGRKQRSKFTNKQLELLEKEFEKNHHLVSRTQLEKLIVAVGLTAQQIQIWFQNRRAKLKKHLAAQQRLAVMKSSTSSYWRTSLEPGCVVSPNVALHQSTTGYEPLTPNLLPLMARWPLALQLSLGLQLQTASNQADSNREEHKLQKENSSPQQVKKIESVLKQEPLKESTNTNACS
jgi:hypothetical protein